MPSMAHRQTRGPASSVVGATYLNCPRCGLTITPRAGWLTVEHCPRCMARNGIPVGLFASTLPTGELYAADAAPGADRFVAPRAAERRR
jgi:hypothetical protein